MYRSHEVYRSLVQARTIGLDDAWLEQFVEHAVDVINSVEKHQPLAEAVEGAFNSLAEICDLAQSREVDVSACRRAIEILGMTCHNLSQNIVVPLRVIAHRKIFEVPLDAIVAANPIEVQRPPFDPHTDELDKGLLDSVIELGQLFPVRLAMIAPGKYLVVDGQRRIEVAHCRGKSTVNATFEDDGELNEELQVVESQEIYKIPLGAIPYVSPVNVRAPFDPGDEEDQELMRNINEIGQRHPICVTEFTPDQYQLVYGHRRIDALSYLGMPFVEAIIVEGNEHDLTTLSVVENARRPRPLE